MSARLDLAAVRARLAGQGGRAYWRSLEALAETPEFREMVAREFPRHAAVWPEGVSRRRFLELMAASLGLAGLAGCARSGGEQIAPYARTREPIAPGTPLFYATALTLGGIATGVLVESHTGRPTKVEGNPEHPTSRGATDVFSQAAVLRLYDPDRSAVVTERGRPRGYDAFVRDMRAALAREAERQGAGIRILTRTVTSPTLAEQLRDVLRRYPRARWHQYEPLGPSRGAHAGALAAFGQPMQVRHRLDRAERIVALDADFLGCVPANLGVIADWAARRRIRGGAPAEMNRLYAVESTLSVSGSVADHRLAVRSRDVADVALALAARVGVDVGPAAALAPPPGAAATWIEAAAEDLRGHRGAGLVIAGDAQPGLVHALAHAMNGALGNVGYTLAYAAPLEAEPVDQLESLAALVRDLDAGGVGVLLILGGNPVYDAPADLDVATAIARADLSVHVGLYADETAARCRWHVPEAHELEAWSDARAPDGTVTIAQPLIAPLHGGRSAHEVLEVLGDHPERPGHDIVRAVWQKQSRAADFERFWRQALHRGVVPETGAPARSLVPDVRWSDVALDAAGAQTGALEIVFRPDPKIYDGRFANNGWLQELPHPITKITWDNAAMLAPATAERLGIASEDVVELRYRGHQVAAPAWVLPGHAENSITVPLGYGRRRAGRVGTGVGFDAFALRTSAAPWFDGGLEIVKTGRRHRLAVTSRHHDMHAREPVVSGTLEQYRRDPGGLRERQIQGPGRPGQTPLTLYPEVAYTNATWPSSGPAAVRVSAETRQDEVLTVAGIVDPDTLHAEVDVAAINIDAARWTAAAAPADAPAHVASGRLAVNAHAMYDRADGLRVFGEAAIDDLAVNSRPASAPLLHAPRVTIRASQVTVHDGDVVADRVRLSRTATVAVAPGRSLDLQAFRFETDRIAWPSAASSPVRVAATLEAGGRLTADGEIDLASRSAAASVRIEDVALAAIGRLVGMPGPLDGRVGASFALSGSFADTARVTARGGATAESVRIGPAQRPWLRSTGSRPRGSP